MHKKDMTTIHMIHTIHELKYLVEQALDLVEEYSGGESETAEQIQDALEKVMELYHAV